DAVLVDFEVVFPESGDELSLVVPDPDGVGDEVDAAPDDFPRRLRRDQNPFRFLIRRVLDRLGLGDQSGRATANESYRHQDLAHLLIIPSGRPNLTAAAAAATGMAPDNPAQALEHGLVLLERRRHLIRSDPCVGVETF